MSVRNVTLGQNRNAPRVYLEGRWLLEAGFAPEQTIMLEFTKGKLKITTAANARHVVSSKRGVPVLDVNNQQLAQAFGACKELEVRVGPGVLSITPARTQRKLATRVRNGMVGALFAGAGFFDLAAAQAGFTSAFAVEVDADYADLYSANHPGAQMFNQSISEVNLEDLPPVELLVISPPCEPFSNNRTVSKAGKRDRDLPAEAHDHGDLTFWALRIVDHLNPATVVVENVPAYLKSASGRVLQRALERLGYTVEARVLDSLDYGALTSRKRAVLIASSDGVQWPEPMERTRTLGEILDPVEGAEWFDFSKGEKQWLKDHWDRQTAKGNGFASQQVTSTSPSVGTITRRYFAGQGDNPVVKHPTKPHTYRWFTLPEVRRLHDVPDAYYIGDTKTRAGEVIGQGVVVGFWAQVLRTATGKQKEALA